MRGPTKRELEDDCECLLDLLDDLLQECAAQGCLHSADLMRRTEEWLEPADDADDDVIEVLPER